MFVLGSMTLVGGVTLYIVISAIYLRHVAFFLKPKDKTRTQKTPIAPCVCGGDYFPLIASVALF
jgi:hypothetical protein